MIFYGKYSFNNNNVSFYRNYPIYDVNLPFYQIWCQLLHVLTHYFTVCNYAWMFCEGFYLHALMVIAFTKERKLLRICYGIGWSKLTFSYIFHTPSILIQQFDRHTCNKSSQDKYRNVTHLYRLCR